MLQFNGYRPVDILRLIDYGNYAAAKPYLDQYITAAERSTELGVMTPQELRSGTHRTWTRCRTNRI